MRYLFAEVLLRHKRLIALLVAVAAVLPAVELLSVGMVLPILSSLMEQESSAALPPVLARWQALFDGMSLERKLWVLAAAILLLAGVGFVGRLAYALVMTRVHLLVNMHIKRAVLDKLFTMDLAAVQRYRLADLHTYLGPHSNNAGELFASVARPLPAAFGLLLLGAVSLLVSPLGTLMAGALFVAVYLMLRKLHHAQAVTGREQKEQVKEVNFQALDTLNGFRAIAAFSREHVFRGRLWDAFLTLNLVLRRRYILLNMTPGLVATLANAGLALILMGFLLVHGPSRSTVLLFVAFFVIVARMLSYAQQLIAIRSQIAVTYPTTLEIVEFVERRDDHRVPDGDVAEVAYNDKLAMEGVGFSYGEGESFALRDITFEVKRGERVGIVGPSGSGKSTLVDLLLKFHVPTSGRVTLDGVASGEASNAAWRARFGVVPQEAFLFSATIADNIRFGNDALTNAQVRDAADAALVGAFLDDLPEGLDTPVGDRGTRLSGGQRQRVAIARALANQRDILIFDEATSALDSVSERQVRQAIDALPGELTVVIVAHRLSTIANCDRVVVMQDGRVVEQGPPREVDAQGGLFHTLSREQGIDWQATPAPEAARPTA